MISFQHPVIYWSSRKRTLYWRKYGNTQCIYSEVVLFFHLKLFHLLIVFYILTNGGILKTKISPFIIQLLLSLTFHFNKTEFLIRPLVRVNEKSWHESSLLEDLACRSSSSLNVTESVPGSWSERYRQVGADGLRAGRSLCDAAVTQARSHASESSSIFPLVDGLWNW